MSPRAFVLTFNSFGRIDAMTLRYWSGLSIRTVSMTFGPCSSKSLCRAATNSSPSLLREPFGRPLGLALLPGPNRWAGLGFSSVEIVGSVLIVSRATCYGWGHAMRVLLALVFGLWSWGAWAACECRCVNGQNVSVCSSAIDLPVMCLQGGCPMALPYVGLPAVGLPPLGTSSCSVVQVMNPRTMMYEARTICR